MKLSHVFARPELLEQALTHPSFSATRPGTPHNQRLEFLGDSVVGMIVSELLFRELPDWDEGALSRGRSALVCTDTFAKLSEQLGLPARLRTEAISKGLGPKVQADAFEAVVAAVWLDGGWDAAHAFVEPLILPLLRALPREAPPRDPRSLLQELLQARGEPAPTYELVSTSGEAHARVFYVSVRVDGKLYGPAEGSTKRGAAAAAALLVLQAWEAAAGAGAG